MTPSQVRYAVVKYAGRLSAMGASPSRAPHDRTSLGVAARLCHALWMCNEIERMYAAGELEENTEKVMRWLGFVQGCLWSADVYTVDDMKDDNRSAKVRSAPPSGAA